MSPIETNPPRQHAYTGPALPQLPEPSHAERVRTLLSLASVATLSTLSRKHAGFPFGSLMPYALDSEGRPIFLISNMAMHTQNLKADPRASLFVGQAAVIAIPWAPHGPRCLATSNRCRGAKPLLRGRYTLPGTRTADTGLTSRTSTSSGCSLSTCITSADLA